MMRAVRVHRTGDPDVLTVDDVADPEPGPGEVRVRVEAAGLNFIDTYHRRGRYDLELPAALGVEGAGTVDGLGDGVERVAVGDRVGWTGVIGSYAELVVVPAERLVPLPDDLDAETAAAVLLQGMTAHYLSHTTYPLSDGDTCLVLAAAGGVGHLLVQLAADRGARVLATVSTDEKERLARGDGADEVIRYTEIDLVAAVSELTDSHGVDVVYDSVGRDTFAASLDCGRDAAGAHRPRLRSGRRARGAPLHRGEAHHRQGPAASVIRAYGWRPSGHRSSDATDVSSVTVSIVRSLACASSESS